MGWIKVDREIQEHWLWKQNEPFDKRSAWIDLLLMANHKDFKALRKGSLVDRKRGDVNTSTMYLADRWGWSRGKVIRFLALLESDGMITQHGTTDGTTVTIENYNKWQSSQTTDDTTDGTTDGTYDKKDKKNKKGKNNISSSLRSEDIDTRSSNFSNEFENLWKKYPRKAGKKKAFDAYKKARKDGVTYEQIENGIDAYTRYIEANNTDDRYIKHGSTFFNQRAWEDDWTIRSNNVQPNFRGNDSKRGGLSRSEARGGRDDEVVNARFPRVAYGFQEEEGS